MFDLLDTLTLVCGGGVKAAATPAAAAVPKNEAEDSTSQEHDKNNDPAEATTLEPVDAMDAKNYLVVNLSRPMGILFEENYDAQHDGAFVAEINEGCSAAADGSICRGDQVIAIGDKRVSGMDFDEVMKVIEESDTKIKLTLFRGPAESLYGPSGASKEWLDEFVAERGEEAALVEEESESEVMPDIADVAVSPALLDDVAVAAAAADAYALGHTVEADQVLVDSESCDETEADAALEVENEVDVDEEVECEAEVEKEVDESVGAVLIEDEVDADVQLAHETEVANEVEAAEDELVVESEVDMDEEVAVEAEVEDEAEASEDVSVVENEVDMYEEVASEAEVKTEVDTSEDVLVIEKDEDDASDAALEKDEAELVEEEEAVDDEEVAGEAALEKEDASTLNGAVKKTSDDLLDTYYANTASQSVSDALAAVVERENSTIAKSIFVEPRSPNGVEELKQLCLH
jgi:hypothetical protein